MSNPHIKTQYIRDLYANELYQTWRAMDGHHHDMLYTKEFYGYKSGLETAYHRIDQRILSLELITFNNQKYTTIGMLKPQAEKVVKVCENCGKSFETEFAYYYLCSECFKYRNVGLEFSMKTRTGDVNGYACVYLVKDKVSGLTKIAKSSNFEITFKQIKRKMPDVVFITKFPIHPYHKCEKELHILFEDKQRTLPEAYAPTEWFALTDDDISYILHSYLLYEPSNPQYACFI